MPELINATAQISRRDPWNKGKLIGAKPPLRPQHVVVDPLQAPNGRANARLGDVQPSPR